MIQGGDAIDNDQNNELRQSLAALRGDLVRPGSGPDGYFGVQLASNPDPFYYRPDVDAPTYPGLLRAATRSFVSAGLGAHCYPVLGDHDVLVAGEIAPTDLTRALAIGRRAVWDLPHGLTLPQRLQTQAETSPDGPPDPASVDLFLRTSLSGPTVSVPADGSRRELSVEEVISRMRSAAGPEWPPPRARPLPVPAWTTRSMLGRTCASSSWTSSGAAEAPAGWCKTGRKRGWPGLWPLRAAAG